MSRPSRVAVLLAVLAVCAALPATEAVELNGQARLWGGTTSFLDGEDDQLDQKYNVSLTQPLSPWLRAVFTYRFDRFDLDAEDGSEFFRRTTEPLFELFYRRAGLSSRIAYQLRDTTTTNAINDFELSSLAGQFGWQLQQGTTFSLQVRDESNVADVAIFGRDNDSRLWNFAVTHEARKWTARYILQRNELNNNLTGFQFLQQRHLVRGTYSDTILDGRLRFDTDSWVSRTQQEEENPSGTEFGDPVPAIQGLFAVDTTPEVGELDPQPDLIDGDTIAPTVPPIEIGGASTFRNLGLDLGLTRPISALLVFTDAPSDPALIWQVFHSRDNLTWEPVGGVTSVFDQGLLRYVIRFPQTEDRFFKAVNLTPNVLTGVNVTELQAFLEVTQITRGEADSTTYRIFFGTTFEPNPRVTGTFNVFFNNDKSTREGLSLRNNQEVSYEAFLNVVLRADLGFRASYRFSDLEQNLQPVLKRRERLYNMSLDWNPLSTVQGLLALVRTEESGDTGLLRSTSSVRARALQQLYPDLRLISEVAHTEVDDPFSGVRQANWRWAESVETTPGDRWLVRAGFWFIWYEPQEGLLVSQLTRRTRAELNARWTATPYVTLSGDLTVGRDDDQQNIDQRYNLTWTPGPKLVVSLNWFDTRSPGVRQTTTSNANVNYRLNRRILFWASLAYSRFDEREVLTSRTTTSRFGINIIF